MPADSRKFCFFKNYCGQLKSKKKIILKRVSLPKNKLKLEVKTLDKMLQFIQSLDIFLQTFFDVVNCIKFL